MSTKKLTLLSMYTALSLILFTIESALPALSPLPFIRLGLANIITLLVLVLHSPKDAFFVFMLRIFLSTLLTGQVVYMLYSLAGGLSCFIAEYFVNKLLKGKQLHITSIFGAIFHNIGQLFMAIILMGIWVFPYFPYMMLSGSVTGLFIGIAANTLVDRLKNLYKL